MSNRDHVTASTVGLYVVANRQISYLPVDYAVHRLPFRIPPRFSRIQLLVGDVILGKNRCYGVSVDSHLLHVLTYSLLVVLFIDNRTLYWHGEFIIIAF